MNTANATTISTTDNNAARYTRWLSPRNVSGSFFDAAG
jgi:hypothetical protein